MTIPEHTTEPCSEKNELFLSMEHSTVKYQGMSTRQSKIGKESPPPD